ncbi:sodium/calcium exchanger family protein [[Clostridium] sordellii ATCC 9714]|nr:sodium/calcium exchanger family protein [[Clostridium] sordellii ATCC 9714] [Paeniclostridium sordellii ATCC 9714]
MKILKYLLIFIPISIIGEFMHLPPTVMFVLAALSIIPLAGLMGAATEEISFYTGPKIGGFLNATFGNATELIISFFALKVGLFDVVKASIAGSVIGNILLVLGASMLFGGLKHKNQTFNKKVIEVSSSMLLLAVIGLCIPAIFTHTIDPKLLNTRYEGLSIVVAIIMFAIYILSLVFSFLLIKIYTL